MTQPAPIRLSEVEDLWLGDLRRRGRSGATLDAYRRYFDKFVDELPPRTIVAELRLEDYERFLDGYLRCSESTIAQIVSMLHGSSRFVHERGYAAEDVARRIKRPARKRPEELDVVTNTGDDVRRLFKACVNEQELLCVGAACYLGARPQRACARPPWRHRP